jgi:ribonuclease HII
LTSQPAKGAIEKHWLDQGFIPVGVDEVGRGCIAGPVVAAAVALDYVALAAQSPKHLAKIRDSKTLSAKQREEVISLIHDISLDHAVGVASEREIESVGILNATFLAMNRALAQIVKVSPGIVLVDGNQKIKGLDMRQQTVVKGDSLCWSIAAASIVAKEFRDQHMRHAATGYPHWGFDRHVGYGTSDHIAAIHLHGVTPLHRRNFAPVKDIAPL